jgi:uncharacterized protein YutE (UPF0331/DUF86 family)
MIDREIIEGKFDIIETNLKFLEEFKGKDAKELESNYRDLQAVKYSIFEIVEACIDVANHIIASMGFERVEEYSKMFEVLARNKVISGELGEKMARMAKFRNILVHRYGTVKTESLTEILRFHIGDVNEFMKEIKKFLKKFEP